MGIFDRNKSKQPIEGRIGFYGLTEWWLFEFTEQERQHIIDRYRPMGNSPDNQMLIRGKVIENETTLPAPMFLNVLAGWFKSKEDAHIAQRMYRKMRDLGGLNPIDEPGNYLGRHYTTYLEEIKELKRANSTDMLERLLLGLIDAVEADSKVTDYVLAPYYTEQLAILYRKQGEYLKEINILSRYILASQNDENPQPSGRIAERLRKVQLLHQKASKKQQ